MLKFVGICLSLIGIATSQFINTVIFPYRKVYISKMISDEHRESIYNALIAQQLQ